MQSRSPVKRVCIYCASSNKIPKPYFAATRVLAKILVSHGVTIVYGGGASGLMGELANTAIESGGHVVGIMPGFMRAVEWAHTGVKEFHLVTDMHERKKKFLENTDALIALPGGCGTLEELLEAITLKKLGLYTKPIIILNTDQYYDPLLHMLQRTVDENFMSQRHLQMWSVVNDPAEVLPAIENAPDWDENAISFAAM